MGAYGVEFIRVLPCVGADCLADEMGESGEGGGEFGGGHEVLVQRTGLAVEEEGFVVSRQRQFMLLARMLSKCISSALSRAIQNFDGPLGYGIWS